MSNWIFRRASVRLLVVVSLMISVAGWVWHSNAQTQSRSSKKKTPKITAQQVAESRERLEERARERARKLANGKPLIAEGKPVHAETRTGSDREALAKRPPFGLEADGLTRWERTVLYDKPSEAARFFRQKRLPRDKNGKFTMQNLPLERYLAAENQMREMPVYSSAHNKYLTGESSKSAPLRQKALNETQQNTWQPLGPGNIGGRTRALVINPQNPNVMYAAGVSGGVWKTTDAGQSWTPIGDRMAQLTVSSLLLDPTNSNVLFVGTGEGVSAFDQDTQGDLRGLGIFKSTDAGATFTRLEATNNSDFYFVNDLVVSPSSNQRIYAATRTGVWRTTDSGTTWTRVLTPRNEDNDLMTGGCLDLAIRTDKKDADVVFAACGTFEQAQIFRTVNGASNDAWEMVLTEPLMGRTQLAIAPSNQEIIYALASELDPFNRSSYQFALHAVFRSATGGASGSWAAAVRNSNSNKLNTSILSFPIFAFATDCGFDLGNDFTAQAWYDLALAVDPLDPQRVWVGGIDLFRSDDGGANWGQASHAYLDNRAPQYLHTDQHTLVFHPQYNGTSNQILYIGNDGGLWRTENARAGVATGTKAACASSNTAVTWRSLNNGYGVTQFYHGAVHPDGKSYVAGAQDNGTLRGNDADGVNNWRELYGGDGGYVAIDRNSPNVIYAEAAPGFGFFSKSTDNGLSFGSARFGLNDGGGLFIAPFATDPSDPNRLWAGGFSLWRTTDAASRWGVASDVTEGNGSVSALAIAPTDANFVLAGLSEGGYIHYSHSALTTTGATVWQAIQPRIDGFVSSVAFDPNNKNIAYATYSTFGGNHVYRSTNAGISWTSINGNLPDVPAHSIVVDPSNSARLYLGTDVGIFVSNDTGVTWAVENAGFTNAITESLQLNLVNGEAWLYAFTHGRGAWRVKLAGTSCAYGIAPATVNLDAAAFTNSINVSAQSGSCAWTATSNVSWLRATGSGNASGQLSYSVDANPSVLPRTGTVTVAGRSLVVTQAGFVDRQAPVIAITEPNANNTTNLTGAITLRGTATDNGTISSITWNTDRGNAGVATLGAGSPTWTALNIPLVAGENLITVTARDAAGNIARAAITVISRPTLVVTTYVGSGIDGSLSGQFGDGGPASAADLSRPNALAFDTQGNLYVADTFSDRIRRVTQDGRIATIAGGNGTGDRGDGGLATAAQFYCPSGLALDASGNLFIADRENHRIRRIAAADGIITTVAGTGIPDDSGDNGPGAQAKLDTPYQIALRGTSLYIADTLNHRIRRLDLTTGVITNYAGTGSPGLSGDGAAATAATLREPRGVAVDAQGNVYIADSLNHRIRRVDASTGVINTVAGTTRGYFGDGGAATAARLSAPEGIWVDAQNNLLIGDTSNAVIRRVNTADGFITTLAGSNASGFSGDGGAALAARFLFPTAVVTDATGRVLIADRDNHRVRLLQSVPSNDNTPPVLMISQPTTATTFTANTSPLRLTGTATDNGTLLNVTWANDRGFNGLATGAGNWTVPAVPLVIGLNNLTITAYDLAGNQTRRTLAVTFAPALVVTTLAGNGTAGSSGDGGQATLAQLFAPRGVAVDARGNVYVADTSHRVRRIAPGGQITAFAGNGIVGNAGDGSTAVDSNLNQPRGLAVDSAGNVYIADTLNHRIRKVTASDGRIATIAGTGIEGSRGDGGPATQAELNFPTGIVLDSQGNIYIGDTANHRVRKITVSDGKITTIAGNGEVGFSGDGGNATAAQLNGPVGVAVDAQNTVYFVDQGNQRIRRVTSDGMIATYAGTGATTFNGDDRTAITATLSDPRQIALDAAGDLYVADQGHHRIRKIARSTGMITTVAGSGIGGFSGDNGLPTAASFAIPQGVAVDAQGNLFIADTGTNRVRKVQAASNVRAVASVSAASYLVQVAPDSIVAAFGDRLATAVELGQTVPLPTTLAGTTIRVRDSAGIERLAPLFFVSPGQINYLVPSGTSDGLANVAINTADGSLVTGTLSVVNVAPGIFAANADGQGVPSAVTLRVKADGAQLYENIARFDSGTNRFVATPIDLGPDSDQVFLILYGTGLRGRSALSNVTLRFADLNGEVLYVGESPGFIGLDQVNVRIPRGLIGRGEITLTMTVDGRVANSVRINVK